MPWDFIKENVPALIIGLFGGGGIVTLVIAYMNREKTKAEVKKIRAEAKQVQAMTDTQIVRTAQEFTGSLLAELGVLRKELKELGQKYDDLNQKYLKLQEENIVFKFEVNTVKKRNVELELLIEKYNRGT